MSFPDPRDPAIHHTDGGTHLTDDDSRLALVSYCDEVPHPKEPGRGRVCFRSQFHVIDHCLETKTQGTWGSWSHQIYNQEGRARKTCIWGLSSLSFSFSQGGSTHEMVPPTFKVDLPTSINQTKNIPQRCAHEPKRSPFPGNSRSCHTDPSNQSLQQPSVIPI